MNNILPELHSNRLSLTDLNDSDLNDVFEVMSNKQTARFTSWQAHESIEDTQEYLKQRKNKLCFGEDKKFLSWAIRLKKDGIFIGTIDFEQENKVEGYIDYVLAEEKWGQGIMTEAVVVVRDWVFDNIHDLKEINICSLSENLASLKVMQNAGFIFKIRELQKLPRFQNKAFEVICYEMSKEEWMLK